MEKGKWLRDELSDLVRDVTATERGDLPRFNKGLEVKCAIEAKLRKILNHKESAPAMYEALEELTQRYDPTEHWTTIDKAMKALALARGEG